MLPPEVPSRQAIARADSGLYEAYALSDGVTRLYGYAKVADLPLYANFGVPLSTVRQTWLRGLLPVGGLLALAALLGCAAVLQAVQGVRAEVDRGLLEEARRRAEYQETLLRELHHRVKNSLMTVQALVRIRGGNTGADKVLQQRIMALGQVHDLLHVSEFVSRLDLSAFLRALCANPAVAPPEGGVTVHCDTDPVEVGVEQAVPLSLIVVELLTNALKHAFPSGRAGRITIGLRHIGDHACLSLRDDGVGLPPATQHGRRSGLWLVERLVGQIQGHLEIRRQGGTEFRLTFPLRLDQPPDAVGTGA
nr:ATP-binding protein [Pararoseomonas baculiformis]